MRITLDIALSANVRYLGYCLVPAQCIYYLVLAMHASFYYPEYCLVCRCVLHWTMSFLQVLTTREPLCIT
jgi:hypothetical protein